MTAGLMKQETGIDFLEFFQSTQKTWDAIYADCAAAHHSIEFEQYLFENDETGQHFLSLFCDKARQGVRVRIILDAFGSRAVRDSPLIDEIRKAGGTVEFYNPIGWRDIFLTKKWLPRTHCKILIIDELIAYIGGVCIGTYMREWRDLHIRITGAPAQMICLSPDYPPHNAFSMTGYEFMPSRHKGGSHLIYRALLEAIERAQKSICLVTPYFFPPRRLRKALAAAARRGVDVRLLISEKSDIPWATFLSRSYFPSLIRRGLKIYISTDYVIHAKYAIVDDDWAMAGSSNFDYLSLVHNQEANLIVRDQEAISCIQAIFDENIAPARAAERHHPLLLSLIGPLVGWLRKRL